MIYYVKPGQSLADLCDQLHIENVKYLKDYHNQNCSLSDRFEVILSPE
jgi:hypothetical protein